MDGLSVGDISLGAIIMGGIALLGLGIGWGYFRSAKRDNEIDPNTPGDDPSKGM